MIKKEEEGGKKNRKKERTGENERKFRVKEITLTEKQFLSFVFQQKEDH